MAKDYSLTKHARMRQLESDPFWSAMARLWGIWRFSPHEGARVAADAEARRLIAERNARGFPAWMYGKKGPPE